MTESQDLDLTPRDADDVSVGRKRLRNWLIMGTFTAVIGFVLFQALTSAAQFYYNVDEAVARRGELEDSTFRIQGTVTSEQAPDANGALIFTIAYGGVDTAVRHVGAEPSDLFEIGIPVVSEGHWEGDVFQSRQLLVKHSESYEAENPDRVEYDLDDTPGYVPDNTVE
mgnify:CR=1 FL=1|jgi:cytochrome c-type biogenesis protein CcmE